MSPRQRLLAHLGPQAWLKTSYVGGRSGFLAQSLRSIQDLRANLVPRYACRLTEVHRESGKFFIEPSSRFLVQALRRDMPHLWWRAEHQVAAAAFFVSWRAERVRRGPLVFAGSERMSHLGFRGLRDLALRSEALAVTPRPDKHWRGLAESFDALWRSVPLQSAPLLPLAAEIFAHLQRCHRQLEDYPQA